MDVKAIICIYKSKIILSKGELEMFYENNN